jgi:hypothetical protein
MTPVVFEPTISVLEQAKTVHTLDRAAAVINQSYIIRAMKLRTIGWMEMRNKCIPEAERSLWRLNIVGKVILKQIEIALKTALK